MVIHTWTHHWVVRVVDDNIENVLGNEGQRQKEAYHTHGYGKAARTVVTIIIAAINATYCGQHLVSNTAEHND